MILTHEDLSAIEQSLGPIQAAPIINALEKLEQEQKVEIKKDLLLEIATKADIARLEGTTKADIARLEGTTKAEFARLEAEVKGEIKRLEMLIKVLIGLVVLALSLFSPAGVELIKLIK